ncbi:MAG: hypothetical protein RBR74_00860 [Ignavibacteriaceae bacterium]|jgi:uncharacterized membrane protein|nr:hypothetical protein [Ignavibacteriaceae bacterium]
MSEVYTTIRAIHILAAALWLGLVMVINFVILPVLSGLEGEFKRQVVKSIFPRIFILASVFSATVVITGLYLVYYLTNGNLEALLYGRWGISILIGSSLGILLTLFHFFLEGKLSKKISMGKHGDNQKLEEVHLKMKIVPRVGLTILTVIFLLMINAAHGIF